MSFYPFSLAVSVDHRQISLKVQYVEFDIALYPYVNNTLKTLCQKFMTSNYSFAHYYKASSTLGFPCIVDLGYINVKT